jgi:U4/U6.U5 tri-snRNP-associated protein 1
VTDQKRAQEEAELARRQQKEKQERPGGYSANDLRGLKVLHGAGNFDVGEEVILTLADSNILDTDEHGQLLGLRDDDDVLQNPLMLEEEQRLAREKRAKRAKQPVYSGFDDDEFESINGGPGARQSTILAHYDKEAASGPRLVLGESGMVAASTTSSGLDAAAMFSKPESQSLSMEITPSSDFYTPTEYAAFHKPRKDKKVRKIRKRASDEDDVIAALEAEAAQHGGSDLGKRSSTAVNTKELIDATAKLNAYQAAASHAQEKLVNFSLDNKKPKVAFEDDDADMAQSLSRARRLALKDKFRDGVSSDDRGATTVQEMVQLLPPQPAVSSGDAMADLDDVDADGRRKDGTLIFTSTTEFTARLSARINEVSRSRAEAVVKEQEQRDVELVLSEAKADEDAMEGMEEVDQQDESTEEPEGEADFAHSQPLAAKGMAATLALIRESGDLHQKKALAGRAKDSRALDPSEDAGVKIEYRDEFGRQLTQKEAFRQLSYRFHGYGPGKKKQEKRLREMDARSKEHSSKNVLDSGTMKSLTKTQEATGKAHVTIQGAATANSAALAELIAKTKTKVEKKAAEGRKK